MILYVIHHFIQFNQYKIHNKWELITQLNNPIEIKYTESQEYNHTIFIINYN